MLLNFLNRRIIINPKKIVKKVSLKEIKNERDKYINAVKKNMIIFKNPSKPLTNC